MLLLHSTDILVRFLHALFYAIDGNFVSNQKDKNTDSEDFLLSMGGGYFINENDARKYEKTLGIFKPKVRVCLSFLSGR